MAKLQKFKQNDNKNKIKIMLISLAIIMVGIITFVITKTYAIYSEKNSYDVIKSKIGDFRNVKEIYVLNNKITMDQKPPKNEHFNIENITCNNGSAEWDYENWNLLNIYYNNNKSITCTISITAPLCIRATELHTEECVINSSNYCVGSGYTNGSTITYGNLGIQGILASGDAFDCDVNGDGIYNSETERFYYVSDYYNTQQNAFESDTAVLLYYNNTTKGISDNSTSSLISYYENSMENWHGPTTAIRNLPTTTQWRNVTLKNTTRAILNEKNGNTTKGGMLISNFDYSAYSTRLLTMQEIKKACNQEAGNYAIGELDNCIYLFENTHFSTSTNASVSYWLENPRSVTSTTIWRIHAGERNVKGNDSNYNKNCCSRPVIEVPITNIDY